MQTYHNVRKLVHLRWSKFDPQNFFICMQKCSCLVHGFFALLPFLACCAAVISSLIDCWQFRHADQSLNFKYSLSYLMHSYFGCVINIIFFNFPQLWVPSLQECPSSIIFAKGKKVWWWRCENTNKLLFIDQPSTLPYAATSSHVIIYMRPPLCIQSIGD